MGRGLEGLLLSSGRLQQYIKLSSRGRISHLGIKDQIFICTCCWDCHCGGRSGLQTSSIDLSKNIALCNRIQSSPDYSGCHTHHEDHSDKANHTIATLGMLRGKNMNGGGTDKIFVIDKSGARFQSRGAAASLCRTLNNQSYYMRYTPCDP